jgi:hypothetical protein
MNGVNRRKTRIGDSTQGTMSSSSGQLGGSSVQLGASSVPARCEFGASSVQLVALIGNLAGMSRLAELKLDVIAALKRSLKGFALQFDAGSGSGGGAGYFGVAFAAGTKGGCDMET